uniref:Uncharacterized protein n=1 Tax=Cannabis sativa TaxID=3483 RepID=A0A803PMI6_CANSA
MSELASMSAAKARFSVAFAQPLVLGRSPPKIPFRALVPPSKEKKKNSKIWGLMAKSKALVKEKREDAFRPSVLGDGPLDMRMDPSDKIVARSIGGLHSTSELVSLIRNSTSAGSAKRKAGKKFGLKTATKCSKLWDSFLEDQNNETDLFLDIIGIVLYMEMERMVETPNEIDERSMDQQMFTGLKGTEILKTKTNNTFFGRKN